MAGAVEAGSASGVPGSVVGAVGTEALALLDFFFFVVDSPFVFDAFDLLFFVDALVAAVDSPLMDL